MTTYNITTIFTGKQYDAFTVQRLAMEAYILTCGFSTVDWSNFEPEDKVYTTDLWLYYNAGNFEVYLGDDPLGAGSKTSVQVSWGMNYDQCVSKILDMCEVLEP